MLTLDGSVVSIAVLGAMHGINPAMGWLFAVSLGLQARSGRVVLRALGPLALGHALAIGATVSAAATLGLVVPLAWLQWMTAGALLSFGALHLLRHHHPRGGGMSVTAKDLTVWSFLVASAHGAGLMVLPFVLADGGHVLGATAHVATVARSIHTQHAGLSGLETAGILATLLHSASYLAVAGATAWLFYKKLGLRLLRHAWINMNVIWAAALVVTGVVTLLL
jgi:hypothetical protein